MCNLREPELLRAKLDVEPCGTWFQVSGGCPKPPRSFIGRTPSFSSCWGLSKTLKEPSTQWHTGEIINWINWQKAAIIDNSMHLIWGKSNNRPTWRHWKMTRTPPKPWRMKTNLETHQSVLVQFIPKLKSAPLFFKKISPCENPNSRDELQYKPTAPKAEPSIKSKSAEHKTKASLSGALRTSCGTFQLQTFTSKYKDNFNAKELSTNLDSTKKWSGWI